MKIYSPNKEYTGISASVPFCGGVGETEDPYLIEWFKSHGYEVGKSTDLEAVPENSEEICENMEEPLLEMETSGPQKGKRARK